MPDATTTEAVAVLKRLTVAAFMAPRRPSLQRKVDYAEIPHDVHAAAWRALHGARYYATKTVPARLAAIDRAIATLEAQP